MRFGFFFGLENEALIKVFDISKAFSGIRKNTPLRAPPLWRVGMDSHSLAPNEIAFVYDHISLGVLCVNSELLIKPFLAQFQSVLLGRFFRFKQLALNSFNLNY